MQGSCLSVTFFSFGFRTVLPQSQGLRITFSTQLLYRPAVRHPHDSPLLHAIKRSHLRDLFQDSSSSHTKKRSWGKRSWAEGTVKSQISGSVQNYLSNSPCACVQGDTGKVQPPSHWMRAPLHNHSILGRALLPVFRNQPVSPTALPSPLMGNSQSVL